MKNKDISKQVVIILIVIILLIVGGYSFLFSTPTVKLSCKEGVVMGFGKMSMPPMVAVPPPLKCSAEITITNSNGETICNVKGNEYETEIIELACRQLKKYKNQEVTITFSTNSIEYGEKSGTQTLKYGR